MYKTFNPYFSPGSETNPNEIVSNVKDISYANVVQGVPPKFKECKELDCDTDSDCKEKNCDTCDTTTKKCKPRVVNLNMLPQELLTNIASQKMTTTDLASMSETSLNLHEGSILERKRHLLIQLISNRDEGEITHFFEDNPRFSVNCLAFYDDTLNTPLTWAVHFNSISITTMLLDRGADPNITNPEGSTPLIIAIHNIVGDNIDIPRLLLNRGASPNIETKSNITPLSFLISSKNLIEIEEPNYINLIQLMLEKGADPNNDVEPILHTVIKYDDIQIVELLVDYGADINSVYNMQTPLGIAIDNDKDDIVEFLVKKRANLDITIKGKSPLSYYLRNLNEDPDRLLSMVTLLLRYKCGITNELLITSSDNNLYEYTKLLITKAKKNKNLQDILNVTDSNGTTPLMIACGAYASNIDNVKLLLDKGADPNIKDSNGNTAIMYLLMNWFDRKSSKDTLKLLLEYDLDLTLKNNDQETVLHMALHKYHWVPSYHMFIIAIIKHDIYTVIDNTLTNEEYKNLLITTCFNFCDSSIIRKVITIDPKYLNFKVVKNTKPPISEIILRNDLDTGEKLELVKLLLETVHFSSVQKDDDKSSLAYSIQNGYIEIVKILLTKTELTKNEIAQFLFYYSDPINVKFDNREIMKLLMDVAIERNFDVTNYKRLSVGQLVNTSTKFSNVMLLTGNIAILDLILQKKRRYANKLFTWKDNDREFEDTLFNYIIFICCGIYDFTINYMTDTELNQLKLDFFNLLLKHGADINKTNVYGYPPLEYCCKNGNSNDPTKPNTPPPYTIIKLLLEKGADPNITHFNEGTPLFSLIKAKAYSEISVDLRARRLKDSSNGKMLELRELTQLFIDKGVDLKKTYPNETKSVLYYSVKYNFIDVTKLIVENSDMSYNPIEDIVVIFGDSHLELLKYLSTKLTITKYDILDALEYGRLDILRYLLTLGIITIDEPILLHQTLLSRIVDLDGFKILRYGDEGKPVYRNYTNYALKYNIARLLLKKRANPDILSRSQQKSLQDLLNSGGKFV